MEERIQVRCPVQEKAALEAIAEHIGIPLSYWIRQTMRAEARRYSKEHGLPEPFVDEDVSEGSGDADTGS